MSISDDLLKKWLDHVITNLDWNDFDRRKHERRKKEKAPGESGFLPKGGDHIELDIPFILPHEFIFLLCNSLNRLTNINRLHQPDLSSDLYHVNLQELG